MEFPVKIHLGIPKANMAAIPALSVGSGALTLPLLKDTTRYTGVPKRYEDTKAATVQNFTHRYIVDLGERFHRASLDKYESDKIQAVKAAEAALLERAEAFRRESIAKALQKATAANDKEMKKKERAFDRKLKEELFRLEQQMRLSAEEELKKMKTEAEERQAAAVAATEQRCEERRLRDVEQARVDERLKSQQDIDDLKTEFKDKFAAAEDEWKRQKLESLAELTTRLSAEREHAVHCAQHVERVIAQEMHAKQQQLHEQAMRVLNARVAELKAEIVGLQKQIELILQHKRSVEEEVLSTRRCFQNFIDGVKPFEPEKSEYIMPPLRLNRTQSLLEFELPKKTDNVSWSLPYGAMDGKM